MDAALTVAVVPAAITAAGTVLAAVIRAWRTGPDGSRRRRPTARDRSAGAVKWTSVRQRSEPTGCRARSFVPVTADERGARSASPPHTPASPGRPLPAFGR